jgi:hypothetical protein
MRQSFTCATRGRRQGAGKSRHFLERQENNRRHRPGGGKSRAGTGEDSPGDAA